MTAQHFALHPFPAPNAPHDLYLDATITRQANVLALCYELTDPRVQVIVPPRVKAPVRRHTLWQTTCFEFFVAARNATPYWEFNLAPSGDWNVYRLESYRQKLTEEKQFATLPFRVNRQSNALALEIEIDLGKIIAPAQSIELSATAVIECADGALSYWAIAHRGEKPDFHLRESFGVEM